MMDSKDQMMAANDQMMMSGGGGCMSKSCKDIRSVVNGYEEFTLDGKNYRVYGSMNGMTPREYVESWGKPLTNAYFRKRSTSSSKKSSPPKKASPKRQPKWSLPENPTRRQPSRKSKTSAMRRASMGGKRKNNKTKKQRKH
jgi:hypothetical protein